MVLPPGRTYPGTKVMEGWRPEEGFEISFPNLEPPGVPKESPRILPSGDGDLRPSFHGVFGFSHMESGAAPK